MLIHKRPILLSFTFKIDILGDKILNDIRDLMELDYQVILDTVYIVVS